MSIHVIIGADDALIEAAARKFVHEGDGLETVDSALSSNAEARLADLDKVLESLATPPFLEPRKATWWKNVDFLSGEKATEELTGRLERLAEKLEAEPLPENQVFILSGPQCRKTSRFAKILAPCSEWIEFEPKKGVAAFRETVVRAMDAAKDMGLSFAPGVAERFVTTVGTDVRTLLSELSKLRDYLGSSRAVIETADVETLSSPDRNAEIPPWDLTDPIGLRDPAAALAALRKADFGKGFDVYVIGVIERFFRRLLDVKRGRATEAAPFLARKEASFVARWSERELRSARARFLALRERVVSGTVTGGTLVTTELLRAMGRRRAR